MYHKFRVHEIAYGFGGPSEKMSALIDILLQNTNILCQSFAKSAQILLVMSDRTD
jgi:hypothetical protein